MPDNTYKEKIALELDASGIQGNSLRGLITQLAEVEQYIQRINSSLNVKGGGGLARGVNELQAEIQKLQSKSATALNVEGLSKGLKLDQQEFERFLAKHKASLKDYQSTLNQFRSAPAAARAIARYERERGAGQARLGDLLKPSVSQVHGGGTMSVSGGKIALEIPAAQVQASVVGPVTLNIPGSQVSGGGRDPQTGQFVAGGGGGGGRKSGGKGPLGNIPAGKGMTELQRVRVDTDKYLRETVTAVDQAGQIIATVHDSIEGIIKTSVKTTTGASPLAQFREARRLAEENFRQLKAMIDPNDPGIGLAKLQSKQAAQLRALLQFPALKQISGPQQQELRRQIEAQANTLEAKGIQTFLGAQNFRSYGMADVRQRLGTRILTPNTISPWMLNQAFFTSGARARVGYGSPIGPQPPPAGRVGYTSPIGPGTFPPPIPPAAPKQPVSPFARGLRSFTPTGFAANLLNVSGWAAAVGVLYKSLELADYSLARFLDLGQQTARLSVVFRGVGGSAKELTDDILQLAAANGRDSDEAMESATEWSRLGLSRNEVNEAVRVSMEAANVSGLKTTETTKQLASLMHIYNLEVGDLSGVLGMLTTTSQQYNVTLEDLFQGLDRSAGSARLARVGLAELQGFIGTVVGKTGQSGTVVGNTIKSLLVNFANPDIQQYLRRFGVETLDKNLSQKGGSEILRDLFVKWQTMDDRQKQNLTFRLVGRYSAARFAPMMNDYVQAQNMAIESQLNLNAAQEANNRITETMKSQLAGLRSEFDRMIVSQGNKAGLAGMTPMEVGASGVRTGKNVLRMFNDSGVNLVGLGANVLTGGSPMAQALVNEPPWAKMINWFNAAMEHPSEMRQSDALLFTQKIQRMTSGSGALAMRGRLLDTIAEVLPRASGTSLESMTSVAASQLGGDAGAFQKAIARGDIAGAQAILRQGSKGAMAESLKQSGEAVTERTAHLADLKLSLQNVNADVEAMQKKGASQAQMNQRLEEQKELEQEIRELETDRSQAADNYAREAAEVSDVVELKQQYLNLLEEEKTLMQGINELAEQSTLGTAGSRLDAQVAALTSSIDLLKAQKEILDERGGTEDTQAAEELRKQIADSEARKAALQSPQVQATTRLFDARQIASQRAREEAASYAVGYTESEKLLRQRQSIQNTLGRLNNQPERSDNDRVRIKELEIALWQNQEKIQTRIVELSREERQIRIDSSREFQKNLLLAGPQEQVQRLYVASLANRHLTSGQFNAMSPEMKRMYYELRGGEAGARAREEEGLLHGRGMTVEQQQKAYEDSRSQVDSSNRLLDFRSRTSLQKLPPMPLPQLDPLVSSGRAASEQLGILAGNAGAAARALAQLPQAINSMAQSAVRNALPKASPAPSSPRLNVHSGFALGASAPRPAQHTSLEGMKRFMTEEALAGDAGGVAGQ